MVPPNVHEVGRCGVSRASGRTVTARRKWGYMRIDKNERIAGLSALEVRRLLREIGESHIDVDATAKILGQVEK